MPVPRRKQRANSSSFLFQLPSMALRLFDINFVFQKTRVALFYSFAPAVIWVGMNAEPSPAGGVWEILNILE